MFWSRTKPGKLDKKKGGFRVGPFSAKMPTFVEEKSGIKNVGTGKNHRNFVVKQPQTTTQNAAAIWA